MRIPSNLVDTDRHTYEKIFHPSASQPLEWREVRSLFREIAQVRWEANGDFKVVRNGHVLILRPAPTRDVSGPDEVLELRRFIERSDEIPPLLASSERASTRQESETVKTSAV